MASEIAIRSKTGLSAPGAKFLKTGLQFNDSITERQWEDVGELLSDVHHTSLWWIGDWLTAGEDRKWVRDDKYEGVKERFGLEYQTCRDAVWVSRTYELSFRNDNLSFKHHRVAAPQPDRLVWLQRAVDKNWSAAELRRQIKMALPPPMIEIEAGKFRVVYADPPWQYQDSRSDDPSFGAATSQYPVVATDKLCEMDVPGIVSKKQAALFLWATVPMLTDAFQVMARWGFEYKGQFVWDKERAFFGHYNHVQHEILLIGTIGSYVPTVAKHQSIVRASKEGHSTKPERFAEIIMEMYPSGPYVELFARERKARAKPWTYWGKDVEHATP